MQAESPLDDHFLRPRNAGVLEGAELKIQVENPVCGDLLKLSLKLEKGRVIDARFQVYGCPAAIASGSLLTELLKGRTLEGLGQITQDAIALALGGLGTDKVHAAVLARDAIQAAMNEWRKIP